VFRRWRLPITLTASSLAVLLLAGCSARNGDGQATAAVNENGAEPTAVANMPAPVEPPASEPQAAEPITGSLDEFRAQIFGTNWQNATEPQVAQELLDQELRAQGEFIAACMLEQGFTYIPMRGGRIIWPNPGAVPAGTRQWAELWGFGISTRAPETQPSGFIPELASGQLTNRELLAEMSDAEWEAWHQALYGIGLISVDRPNVSRWMPMGGFEEWADVPEQDLGCETRWQMHSREATTPTQFAALQTEMSHVAAAVQTDPRTLDLNARWASCMIDAGEGGWSNPQHPAEVLGSAYWEDAVPAEVLVTWDWVAEPYGPPQPDRSEFRAREIAIAVADWDCRDQIGYDAALSEIDFAHQQAFADQHRHELQAWVAYLEHQRGNL